MSFQHMTPKQEAKLTDFINACRTDWDKPGIYTNLVACRKLAPAPDVAIAAIKATTSAHNRTPAIIPLPGPHWRGSDTPPRFPEPTPDQRCSICFKAQEACTGADHKFVSTVTAKRATGDPDTYHTQVQALRAELAKTKGKP